MSDFQKFFFERRRWIAKWVPAILFLCVAHEKALVFQPWIDFDFKAFFLGHRHLTMHEVEEQGEDEE